MENIASTSVDSISGDLQNVALSPSSVLSPNIASPAILSPVASPAVVPASPVIPSPAVSPSVAPSSPAFAPASPVVASPAFVPASPVVASPAFVPASPVVASPAFVPASPVVASPAFVQASTAVVASPGFVPTSPVLVEINDSVQFQPITADFIGLQLQAYEEALAPANDIGTITQWFSAVFPESKDIQVKITEATSVETAKSLAISAIKNELINTILRLSKLPKQLITPWDVAFYRDEITTRLFGQSSQLLPVLVVVGDKHYSHMVPEELAYGLSLILTGVDGFILALNQTQIVPDLFAKFVNMDSEYTAYIGDQSYKFMTVEFIRGLSTGADWRNLNIHQIVTNIIKKTSDGEVSITFS